MAAVEESDHLPEHPDRRVSPAGLCGAGDGGHGVCVCGVRVSAAGGRPVGGALLVSHLEIGFI